MRTTIALVLLLTSVFKLSAQRPTQEEVGIMLVAVTRNDSMLSGGISSGGLTARGKVVVEPLARLTSSGKWIDPPCSNQDEVACRKFARGYLSKPHTYTVVTAEGRGATVHSKPSTLSECFDYSGPGNYYGAPIRNSAIAASSTNIFAKGDPVTALSDEDAKAIRVLLGQVVPEKLDSTSGVHVYSANIEGKELYVVQRAFADASDVEMPALIFGIGFVEPHRFHFLVWKENTVDEDERVLGTLRLRNGRDFLVTVVSHPEGHFYRVYGIQDDELRMVYSGGGASC